MLSHEFPVVFLSVAVQTVLKWIHDGQLPGNKSETLMNTCLIKKWSICQPANLQISQELLSYITFLVCNWMTRMYWNCLKALSRAVGGNVCWAWLGRGMGFAAFAAKSLLLLGSLRPAVSLVPGDCAFVAWRNVRELQTQKVSLNQGSRRFQRISTCIADYMS